jgi:hypothetical protein
MFITKKALSRRTLLRGAGATLALPFLDAMVPALAAKPLQATPRLGFIYIANGVIQNQWTPTTTGTGWDLTPTLRPLAGVRDQLNVVSGLAHLQADTFGDGTGDHPRASAAWLTGVHAYDRTQPGIDVRLATTADQIAARVIGKTSQLPSLELTVDFPTQGSCDSGDCFYVNTISWRNETTPNPAETHPRVVFERLFGDGGSSAQRLARFKSTGSILDSVLQEVNALAKGLGRGDRTKLNEYTDSVREIEQRIQNAESQGAHSVDLIDRPIDVPESFDEYTKMMLDLVALAYQADVTSRFYDHLCARAKHENVCAYWRAGSAPSRVAPSERSRLDHEEGQDRSLSRRFAQPLPDAIEEHTRRGWLPARSQPDAVRWRHGRRQSS